MAKLIEEEARFADPNDFVSQVREYLKAKSSIEQLEKIQKDIREKLFAKLDEAGEDDGNGNLFISLPSEIDGIRSIEKQRRVTRKLDELVAEEIIESNGLSEELYKTIRVVDEDAVMAAHYEGKLSEDEIDRMFPSKIVWALTTKKK